jgi:putative ABC transport system ATP-binding protein
MSILKLDNLSFAYNGSKTDVLKDLSYEFEEGKIYAIVGKSGAGKTTLLSVLSGLCQPNSGDIIIIDESIGKMDKYNYRSKYVGVIFQNFNLLPKLTALENVILSMDIAGLKNVGKKGKAMDLLKKVGLSEDEANRRVLKLSGGLQQRVAMARALSYDPKIVLADEPTGNLDSETQSEIIEIFKRLAKIENKCVIIVTHSKEVARQADEIYSLTAGN